MRLIRAALAAIIVTGVLAACGPSKSDRDRKRAEDRMAIQLSDAQRERDDYKSQFEKTQTALTDAQGKLAVSQQQLDGLRAQVTQNETQLQQATQASEKLKLMQSALEQSEHSNAELQRQIQEVIRQKAELEQKAGAASGAMQSSPPASTQFSK